MRYWLLLALTVLILIPDSTTHGQNTAAADVTYSRDVAPLFNSNCVYCHRPGEVAPFSLMNYKEARPWAKSIRQAVLNRRMPPWQADSQHGSFQGDRMLSRKDLDTIVAWVDGGSREGNPADLPPTPQFAEGWSIGTPDLVLTMAAPYTVPARGTIPWVDLPSNEYVFPEDTWVQAIEIRPGNRAVVHHAIADAEPPADRPNATSGNLHLYSPGLEAIVWKEGYGKLLAKGTRIVFGMHYNAIGKEQTDQTRVGFKFARTPVHTQVNTLVISNNALLVPPMEDTYEAMAAFQFPADARIQAFRPHMHVRGKTATASLILPDGQRRVMLHIPRWDDSWQNYYVLSEPASVPKGAFVEYTGTYDNSPANALNPDPTTPVKYGQQVWEEMHVLYMTWVTINDKNKDDTTPVQIPAVQRTPAGR